MGELSTKPANFNNCVNFCPKKILGGVDRVADFCMQNQCPGPIVQERIVDISESTLTDDNTATSYVAVCGADIRSSLTVGYRPEDYDSGYDQLARDETLVLREIPQTELSIKPANFQEW